MTPFRRVLLVLSSVGWANAHPGLAESAACNQARTIVTEVREMYSSAQIDHEHVLRKMAIAEQLCPSLGEAWKYSYCSASASGNKKADYFKDRAIFNGVQQFDCSPPADPQIETTGPVRKKFALVIGIGTFRDSRVPRLKYAAKDARDFAATLVENGPGNFPTENVYVLTDQQATRGNILERLQQISLTATEDDLVVLFVSSHGSPGDATSGQGLAGIGYLVTYDADLDRIWENAIDYQHFSDLVSHIVARRKVTFLDTCYSGQAKIGQKALTIEGGVDELTAKRFLSGKGTYVITSSQAKERSWESDSLENGFFTHHLRAALRSGTEPPTIREIFEYLSHRVTTGVAKEKLALQTPQLFSAGAEGDLRIGVVPLQGAFP